MKSATEIFLAVDKEIDAAAGDFLFHLQSHDEEILNTSAGENRWSMAQVADHITKSNFSIAKALQVKGTPINRSSTERVEELKNVFLDFDKKFKSPEFILPETKKFKKDELIEKFNASIKEIKKQAAGTELSEMINHKAFGDITKIEILHFILFHLIRHTRQLTNTANLITSKK